MGAIDNQKPNDLLDALYLMGNTTVHNGERQLLRRRRSDPCAEEESDKPSMCN